MSIENILFFIGHLPARTFAPQAKARGTPMRQDVSAVQASPL